MTGTALTTILARFGTTIFTEKVLMNLSVLLLSWIAKRTSNDLDDQVVDLIKNRLDRKNGEFKPNLYKGVKTCK